MITVDKHRLSGTADEIRTKLDYLACDQDEHEYLAGTWFRELAVNLAVRDDLAVTGVSYDGDTAVQELEVALGSAPHLDAIVIDGSQPGDQCQITLERCLSISSESAIE